jgi:S1-C subfamily serine protease
VVAVVVAALVGGALGGGIVAAVVGRTQVTSIREIATGPALLNGVADVQQVIAKVLPAVVSIDATSAGTCSSVLGCSLQGGGVQEEQGTGMIVSPTGQVVTNNHVIAGASSISVTLFGSLKPLPATVIDTDPTNDVALLQIQDASGLPTVTLGDSDHVQVGDAVVAIGNALGLSAGTPTVTQGIISAKGRTVQASDASGSTTETLTNMFQTDAAINPGNSGGPLVSSSGRVIAVNTAVASNEQGTSQAQNIGFAIPVNKIEQLLPALRAKSIGAKGYLGVSLETLTTQLRNQYDFTPTAGAVVLQVVPGSPADRAGLREGDVIVAFDGKAVTSADQLGTAVQDAMPGSTVAIGLYRASARLTFQIPVGTGPQASQPGG